VYALGNPEVGKVVARELAGHFQSLDRLRQAGKKELEEVPGVGPKMAKAIWEFFQKPEYQCSIQALLKAGIQVSSTTRTPAEPFANKTFVLTGSLNAFSRSEAQQIIESLGGRPTSSVSHETDYVIMGQNPGKKFKEAKAKKVNLLQEKEFLSLLRQAGGPV
jgi:DNA ligase (NAD+)